MKQAGTTNIFQKQLDKYGYALNLSSNSINDISNTSIDLKKDLYRFSGIKCAKINNFSVFEFSAGVKVTKDNLFCVEILNTGDYFKLGKWVMPFSADMEDILLEFPLDKDKNFKSFLKCCKQHVNCYSYRQEQYNNLKNVLSNTINCSLDTNLGFTRIHLHMSGIEVIDSGEIYNIILFMAYKSNEALPYLIRIETLDSSLSPKINKIFNKYFKPLKMVNLSAAFEQIIDDKRHFIWKKVSKVSDNVDKYITEEKDEENTPKKMTSNDRKKINSESSFENDLTELEIENENTRNSKYSSYSMENKARSKSDNKRNKCKLITENLDTTVKTQKINKQKEDFKKSSMSIITNKKVEQKSSADENKVLTALNNISTKNDIDKSTKNEESREKKESKFPSTTKDSIKNLRSRRIKANDANTSKSKKAVNKIFDKTNADISTKDKEKNKEKIFNKSSSITKDSVKNLRKKRIKVNDANTSKSKKAVNKIFDKTNLDISIKDKENKEKNFNEYPSIEEKSSPKSLKIDNTSKTNIVKDKTVACEINKSDEKINLPVKSITETILLNNDEEPSNITKTSLKENPYKCFSSTPKLEKRKTKLDDIRLPEISAIASLPANMGSKEDLINILNENDDNSSSVIDCENEQFNEMQAKELLKNIEVACKTIKEKDGKINNTDRKTNKRESVKREKKKKNN